MTVVRSHTVRTARPRPDIPTILVVYYAERSPLRTALADHLYSLKRYGSCTTVYLNIAVRSVPAWVDRLGLDLIVYHTSVLALRWHPPTFQTIRRKMTRLRRLSGIKVAIPQDEFIHTNLLCEFLREFQVDRVLTCADEADWPTIYGELSRGGVQFTRVLTGYLDPMTGDRIERLSRSISRRSVDIAYRAWRPEFWLGRHAQLKGTIADVFESEAPKVGLTTNISVRESDNLLGDAWYQLLLQARWTIGVEGGASVIDRDGSLRERTLDYLADHPGASFGEVEAACFPGLDGSLGLKAISPRHLEACATRTAQALVEGDYNGVLEAEIHYLPLKRDFSNLSEVLSAMANDEVRERLADRAYRDIVATHSYDYRTLADVILSTVAPRFGAARRSYLQRMMVAWESHLDRPSWYGVAVRQRLRPAVRRALASTGLLRPIRWIRRLVVEAEGR